MNEKNPAVPHGGTGQSDLHSEVDEVETYPAVRIGDVADWRLLSVISGRGMGAWLRHCDSSRPVATIFNRRWNADDESLRVRVESAVYDHPQVLDDFTADIVLQTPRCIWVPTELVTDDEEEAARIYGQVYDGEADDIFAETVGEATCLYHLAPGLRSFLQRTFPGSRVHSHLGVMKRAFETRSIDMPRVYIDIRSFGADGGEADYMAFDRSEFVMGVTHRWRHPDDLRYHLFNIMSVFGFNPSATQVSVSGQTELRSDLVRELRAHVGYAVMTMLPQRSSNIELPLAAALLMGR